jgi:hypothetical protein
MLLPPGAPAAFALYAAVPVEPGDVRGFTEWSAFQSIMIGPLNVR